MSHLDTEVDHFVQWLCEGAGSTVVATRYPGVPFEQLCQALKDEKYRAVVAEVVGSVVEGEAPSKVRVLVARDITPTSSVGFDPYPGIKDDLRKAGWSVVSGGMVNYTYGAPPPGVTKYKVGDTVYLHKEGEHPLAAHSFSPLVQWSRMAINLQGEERAEDHYGYRWDAGSVGEFTISWVRPSGVRVVHHESKIGYERAGQGYWTAHHRTATRPWQFTAIGDFPTPEAAWTAAKGWAESQSEVTADPHKVAVSSDWTALPVPMSEDTNALKSYLPLKSYRLWLLRHGFPGVQVSEPVAVDPVTVRVAWSARGAVVAIILHLDEGSDTLTLRRATKVQGQDWQEMEPLDDFPGDNLDAETVFHGIPLPQPKRPAGVFVPAWTTLFGKAVGDLLVKTPHAMDTLQHTGRVVLTGGWGNMPLVLQWAHPVFETKNPVLSVHHESEDDHALDLQAQLPVTSGPIRALFTVVGWRPLPNPVQDSALESTWGRNLKTTAQVVNPWLPPEGSSPTKSVGDLGDHLRRLDVSEWLTTNGFPGYTAFSVERTRGGVIARWGKPVGPGLAFSARLTQEPTGGQKIMRKFEWPGGVEVGTTLVGATLSAITSEALFPDEWIIEKVISHVPLREERMATNEALHVEGSKPQSIRFDRVAWTVDKAKAWLKAHGYKYGKVDTTPNQYRFRQWDPDDAQPDTFGTIPFGEDTGISAVVAVPHRPTMEACSTCGAMESSVVEAMHHQADRSRDGEARELAATVGHPRADWVLAAKWHHHALLEVPDAEGTDLKYLVVHLGDQPSIVARRTAEGDTNVREGESTVDYPPKVRDLFVQD